MKLLFVLGACLALARSSAALYFYLDAGANKCFLEELPKDTIVVGKLQLALVHPARASGGGAGLGWVVPLARQRPSAQDVAAAQQTKADP